MSKTLIFYSNYCQYSKNLINEITKANIREEFLLVCIDSNSYNIPKFVTKVPMLFSKNENRIYVEDEIVDYINKLSSSKNSSSRNNDVQYYSQVEMGGEFSDNFAFLNDENQARSFVFLNDDNTFNDNRIKETSSRVVDDSQSNKLDSSDIEKYMMKRDADFNSAMQSMQSMQPMQRKNI
jgi:hypothetical protein